MIFANPSNQNYSGVISGTGALTKAGAGTLTLSGTNTYSGNTTISGGTLKVGSTSAIPYGSGKGNVAVNGTLDLNANSITINGLSGSGTVTTSVAGTITFTVGSNDQTSSFSGIVQYGSGTVALTKTGTGTLTLSGANTYTGTTTISGGTLQLGDGTTNNGSVAGNITDNAALIFANPSTQSYSGVISGTGSLTKTGEGTLTLSGTDTYSGNTTITSGTLKVGGTAPSRMAPAKATWLSTDTLDLNANSITVNGLSGSGIVTTNAAGTITFTVGSNDQTSSFSGIVQDGSDTVALTKTGTGTLTLSGANTYGGDTTITQGTLCLGASNVLPDSTRVTIRGSGTILIFGGKFGHCERGAIVAV